MPQSRPGLKSVEGQSRRFCDVAVESGSPPRADSSSFSYFFRKVPTRDMNRPEWLRSKGVLVYPPILHDNHEVLGGISHQVDILQWIAGDQQQIGKRALFHHAELSRIRTA